MLVAGEDACNHSTFNQAINKSVIEVGIAFDRVISVISDSAAYCKKVNAEDIDGQTPLHLAAAIGNLEFVVKLLESGGKASTMVVAGICGKRKVDRGEYEETSHVVPQWRY